MRRCHFCVQKVPKMVAPLLRLIASKAPLERILIDLMDFTSLASGGL